jgi:hypothetical protein
LEIILLYENQGAFPDIINPDLYFVGGTEPNQEIRFHNNVCFDLFLIRVNELFAEAPRIVSIGDRYYNYSLFTGMQWFCKRYPSEAEEVGLVDACSVLHEWLYTKKPVSFWCGELDTQFEFIMSRIELISFGGNLSKHNLLRVNALLTKLQRLCERHGFNVLEQNLISVLEPFSQEIKDNRLQYHSSYLIEMLFNYFAAINRLVIRRCFENNTNDVRQMTFPEGTTNDTYKDLYGSTLVFRRFEEQRFKQFRPITTKYLKLRY